MLNFIQNIYILIRAKMLKPALDFYKSCCGLADTECPYDSAVKLIALGVRKRAYEASTPKRAPDGLPPACIEAVVKAALITPGFENVHSVPLNKARAAMYGLLGFYIIGKIFSCFLKKFRHRCFLFL